MADWRGNLCQRLSSIIRLAVFSLFAFLCNTAANISSTQILVRTGIHASKYFKIIPTTLKADPTTTAIVKLFPRSEVVQAEETKCPCHLAIPKLAPRTNHHSVWYIMAAVSFQPGCRTQPLNAFTHLSSSN